MGLGDFVSGIFGSKNESQVKAPPVDPNAYKSAGLTQGANFAQGQAESAQGRAGVQMNTGQIDQSRGQQNDAIGLQRSAALGQQPSVAQMQMQQGMQQAQAAQASAAAGARGGGANLAAAQRMGAMQGAQLGAQGVQNSAMLRAGEMATARDAFGNATTAQRGQDFQQAAGQAGLDAQQRAANDAYSMGMTQNASTSNQALLNAQMQQQAQTSSNSLGAAGIQQKTEAQNADNNKAAGMFGAGTIASAAGSLSDERQKQGVQDVSAAPVTWGDGRYVPSPVIGDPDGLEARANPGAGLQGMTLDMMAPVYGAAGEPVNASLAKGMHSRFSPGMAVMVKPPSAAETHAGEHASKGGDSPGESKDPFSAGQAFGGAMFGAAGKLSGLGGSPSSAGSDPRSGPVGSAEGGPVSFDKLGAGGSLDVNASSESHSKQAQAFQQNPGSYKDVAPGVGQYSDGYVRSDEHSKEKIQSLQTANAALTRAVEGVKGGGFVGAATRAGGEAAEKAGVQPGFIRREAEAVRTAAPAQFLDTLKTSAYNYKPGSGEDPNVRRFGPMAQEVEKTPMGASIVQDTPNGKVLDTTHGFGVALGALGNLNDRMRLLEKGKR